MKYKIKITTMQKEYPAKNFYDAIAHSVGSDVSATSYDDGSFIETTTVCEVVQKNGLFIIRYDENLEGMEDVKTLFKFPLDSPKEITIARTGGVHSILCFEEGKYNTSVYNAGKIPLELSVYTMSIHNDLLTDGTFEMSYIVDFNSLTTQKTNLRMELIKI